MGTQVTFSHFPTIERHCSTFQKPKGVIVSPPNCGRQPAKPGTICQLSCRQGFILSGVREEVRCTTSGKWSAKVQTAVCKGRSPLVWLKNKIPTWHIGALWDCPSLQLLLQTHNKIVGVIPIYTMKTYVSKWWIYKIQLQYARQWQKKYKNQDNIRPGNQVSFPSADENLWGISGPYKAGETKSIFKKSYQHFETCITLSTGEHGPLPDSKSRLLWKRRYWKQSVLRSKNIIAQPVSSIG